jgi:acetyltransferase-like isoleucine patch superfamily enzyme
MSAPPEHRRGALGSLRDLPSKALAGCSDAFAACRQLVNDHRTTRMAYSKARLVMGRGSYGEPLVATFPGDTSRVTVGAFCSFALDVVLMDGGNHRVDWVTTYPFRARYGLPGAYQDGQPTSKGDIVIGNDVWVGRGARVMSGVTIGDGAVIGAYSVVTRNVRPFAIAVGQPARELRRRFADEQISALLRIAWWDWPLEEILRSVPDLCSDNVDGFIAEHDPLTRGGHDSGSPPG